MEEGKTEYAKEELNEQELKALINIVAQTNVPVGQAQQFINLINKMSKMVDELK